MATPQPPSLLPPRAARWRACVFAIAFVVASHAMPTRGQSPSQELQELNRALSHSEVDPQISAALAENLLEGWAARDPAAALRYALDDEHTHAVFLLAAGNVMESWARRDPVAARLFFEQLGEMPAELVAPSLLQGYGSQAPESALEWIYTGGSSEKLRRILAKSVVGVYEHARRIEEIKLWLSLPGVAGSPEGTTAASELGRRLARRNPASAIEFCQSLPPASAARQAAFRETARQWAAGDQNACLKWLSSLRNSNQAGFATTDIDQVIAGFLGNVASKSEQPPTELLNAITDPTVRSALSKKLR